jgi:hypothetical protein
MINIIKIKSLTRFVGAFIVFVSIVIFGGCQWVKMTVKPDSPKQGDIVEVEITAGESGDLAQVEYKINDKEGITNAVPTIIPFDTCKEQGAYHTSLSTWSNATYNDGEIKTFGPEVYDLTVGKISREDNDLTYDLYVAEDNDEDYYDLFTHMADAFYKEFDSYSISYYRNAEPRFYTDQSINFANRVDMVISIGHGNHHIFRAGRTNADIVDFSTTEFGNFSPCYRTGDLEYLVFASCCVLSLDHVGKYLFSGKWFVTGEPTSVAFGDVDGDGKDELGIAVKSSSIIGSPSYWIFDNLDANFNRLHTGGIGWDATSIAFGDVDGDGKDEVGIAIKSNENQRYLILDDAYHNFEQLHSGGSHWESGNYATSIAFGDVDGDGKDEVGFAAKRAGKKPRYCILDDKDHDFRKLFCSVEVWDSGEYATSIAFGDVDGDGKDEVGIAIKSNENQRYLILDDAYHNFEQLHSGGSHWGSGNYATSIAFGDVDDDGKDEVGIAGKAGINQRYWVLDDADHDFRQLHTGGHGWGSGNYATSIAFGDVDDDGKDEVGIARKAGINQRHWVLDDADHDFRQLHGAGSCWDEDVYATSVAFGDVDGDGKGKLGITSNKDDYYETATGTYSGVWVIGDYPDDPTAFGGAFRYWWFHNENTKLNKRPFTGLHMVLGFRTNFSITKSQGSNFLKEFARNLDDGMTVIGSWLEAAMDELPFDYGKNRATVIYLKMYENDTILSNKDDYILGNENYNQQWVDYLRIE